MASGSLSNLFPEAWGVIRQADEVMRAEQWARIHEDMLVDPIPGVDVQNPWGWILRSTAFGSENVRYLQYWQKRVVLPLTTRNAAAAARKAQEIEGAPVDVFAIATSSSSSSGPPHPKASQDWAQRPKAQAKAKASAWVPRSQDWNKGKGQQSRARPDSADPSAADRQSKRSRRKGLKNTN